MENNINKERRSNVRIAVSLPIEFLLFDSDISSKLDFKETVKLRIAMTKNISVGGLCVETDDLEDAWLNDLSSGMMKFALKFKLPTTTELISSTAKAIWIKKRENVKPGEMKYLLGLEFLDINTKDANKIVDFVVNYYFQQEQL